MKIIINGLATEYRERGTGPTLLLLHGWGSSADVFDELVKPLEATHHIVGLNLPGFGGSEMPPLTWGVADYAQFVSDFCGKKSFSPHSILGHSLGGQIAVYGVGTGIFSPQKLILIAAAAIRTTPGVKKRSLHVLAKVGKTILGKTPFGAAARKRLYSHIGSAEYLDQPMMQPIYRRVITEDQTDNARRINCPTLLIWGCDDRDTPIESGRALAKIIPASKFVEFGGGHFVFIDHPRGVLVQITEFLA